jgi:SagB-type dehydrogenase family enzyme
MRQAIVLALVLVAMLAVPVCAEDPEGSGVLTAEVSSSDVMPLPEPVRSGVISIEYVINNRRSVRAFTDAQVALKDLAQLLWAAQGITGEDGIKRAAPSAGAKYPMEIFVVAGGVTWLGPGVYRYRPESHDLAIVKKGDFRQALSDAALSQEWIASAPVSIVITGVYERTMEKYGERGTRYVHIEAGAVAENIYLQAVALKLGTTYVGAFSDEDVQAVLGTNEVAPLGILPVGAPQ